MKISIKKNKYINFLLGSSIFLLLLSLSLWQVKRLEYKESIIKQIAENQNKEISILTKDLYNNYKDNLYRKFILKGKYLHDKEIHLYAQSIISGQIGYDIITPLQTDNGIYLINRGWVPQHKKEQKDRLSSISTELVKAQTIMMPIKKPKFFTPTNDNIKNVWIWLDTNQISNYLQYDIKAVYFQNIEFKNDIFEITTQETNIYNQHAKYAIMWLTLAIIWLIYCIKFIKNKKRATNERI